MNLSEIVERLQKLLAEAGGMKVSAVDLPPSEGGEVLDMRYEG